MTKIIVTMVFWKAFLDMNVLASNQCSGQQRIPPNQIPIKLTPFQLLSMFWKVGILQRLQIWPGKNYYNYGYAVEANLSMQ